MITDIKSRMLEKFHFLNRETETIREEILSVSVFKEISPGNIIVSEGDNCEYLPFVLSGCLRIVKISENGREITLYRIIEGESCVLTSTCILNDTKFPAIAISEEKTEAVFIPSEIINRLIKTSDPLREFVFDMYSKRLATVFMLIEEIAFKRMDSRIAKFLLSSKIGQGDSIETTHQELAANIGTSREVVSRILKDFESKDAISISRGSIRVKNRDFLKKFDVIQ